MCGRFTIRASASGFADLFGADPPSDLFDRPRYNIAPSQFVPAFRATDGGHELVALKWGLLPRFVADPAKVPKPINARCETVARQPMFRAAFKSRRCLIAADGFYEWQRLDARRKQPWYFRLDGDEPFAFAGLWERWGEGAEAVETCTVITTAANDLVAPIHDRMPVILVPNLYDVWLDPVASPRQLQAMLAPYPHAEMHAHPVSPRVNSPRNDGPDLIVPAQ